MIYMIVVVNSVTKPNLEENQVESNVTTSRQTYKYSSFDVKGRNVNI